jgi:transcription elongation factor Elf1
MDEFDANIACKNCGQINIVSTTCGNNIKSVLREVAIICSNCKCRISYDNYSVQHKPL